MGVTRWWSGWVLSTIATTVKKLIVAFGLLIIVGASSWALLRPGFFRTHDYIHAARIAEFARAVQEGHFPVRWSGNFGFGYGMPLFEFYAPLPYAIGALFYGLGLGIIPVIKVLFVVAAAGTAVGSYRLGSKLFGRAGGLVTAAAATLAPYRAVNIFVRGALSEAWGIMAMPWVFYGITRVIDGKRRGWLTVTLSLLVLILSHNIMTMLFVPASLLWVGTYWWYRKVKLDWRRLLQLAASYVLAIGLGAFYIFPALVEKDFTQVGKIFGGYFHYSQHFLYIRQFFQVNWGYTGSAWGPEDGISFFLGYGQLAAVGLVALLLLVRLFTIVKNRGWLAPFQDQKIHLAMGLAVFTATTLYMTLARSEPIWQLVQPLQLAQFPWRWLGLASIGVAVLAGLAISLIKNTVWRYGMAVVLCGLLLGNAGFFKPNGWLEDADALYYTDVKRIQAQMSSILPDYIPVQMVKDLVPPLQLVSCAGVAEFQLDQPPCGDKVEVLVNRGHEKLVKTHFNQPTTMTLAVANFPGWVAELDGVAVPTQTSQLGTLQLEVPSGDRLVGVYFGSSPVRMTSDLISLGSLIVLVYTLIESRKS